MEIFLACHYEKKIKSYFITLMSLSALTLVLGVSVTLLSFTTKFLYDGQGPVSQAILHLDGQGPVRQAILHLDRSCYVYKFSEKNNLVILSFELS